MKKSVIYINSDSHEVAHFKLLFEAELEVHAFDNPIALLSWVGQPVKVDAVVFTVNPASYLGTALLKPLQLKIGYQVPIIWIADRQEPYFGIIRQMKGVAEVFPRKFDKKSFLARLHHLGEHKPLEAVVPAAEPVQYPKIELGKRLFDIFFSLGALLALSPLFLVVAILVKVGSKGPIFYYSYRVGSGYRIFKFWKFRSMKQGADNLIGSLKDLNQYNSGGDATAHIEMSRCSECVAAGQKCHSILYDAKGRMLCETAYNEAKKQQSEPAFIKFKNDPRVTRVGKFIRNTSIDELPQLYNVLIGDMSIVGNRPLPLYEAEKLTTDQFSKRFMAPAGITGLWQVTKRSKGEMSEAERIGLDNDYADNYSLKRDMEIILKTFPALFQKESV